MNNYRKLTEEEILILKSQSCLADNWADVQVVENFETDYVNHTRFSGAGNWGVFGVDFTLSGGVIEP